MTLQKKAESSYENIMEDKTSAINYNINQHAHALMSVHAGSVFMLESLLFQDQGYLPVPFDKTQVTVIFLVMSLPSSYNAKQDINKTTTIVRPRWSGGLLHPTGLQKSFMQS